MSKVFVCYSHKDEKYLDLLLKHFDDDLLDVWSDKRIEGSEHWEEEIQKALESANCGLLILSANFFNSRFIKDIELEELLKNQYEKNTYLVPVLVEHCNIDRYDWINKKEVLPKGFKAIENIKPRNHNKEAVKIVNRVEELLKPVPDSSNTKYDVISHNYPDAIAVNNFPISNDDFFGREKYLDILDKAWDDEQVNIISFIAFGGIGKTSLIDNWLKRMKEIHYKGAKNIFLWSFYSQGSEEDRQVTATEFLLEACKFFKIKKIPKTAYEQGRELANIISKERAILILDGLEPLQYSLEDIGRIKDNGLEVLLKRLSRQNNGLVIITSRIKLSKVEHKYIELDKLKNYEGAQLLKSFELNGTQEELEKISNDFDGHALALKLLGSYTKVVLGKNITRINEIQFLTDDKTDASKHATRMLNSYKKYLNGTVELDILKLLGFFDRVISFEAIDILKNKPLIENINDKLINISEVDWKYALSKLKELHLISNDSKVLDTHPLVREYFSKSIFEDYNNSYTKGHHRLYKYYEKLPEKEYPDSVEEMEPLFQAIYHGCKSNMYNEVYRDLYQDRISRGRSNYLTDKLSRFDLVLKILSSFFVIPFSKVEEDINPVYKDAIMGNVAYVLSTLGKNKKALKIIVATLESSLKEQQYELLIRNVNNIMDINILMGKFEEVELYFEKYFHYTNFCIKEDSDAIIIASYAYMKFLTGNFNEAKKYFLECEKILLSTMSKYKPITQDMPIPKNIYSTMGYMFYDYLFFLQQVDEIEKRIENSLLISKFAGWPLDIGLDYITLARLKLTNNEKQKDILRIYDKGIESLRKSSQIDFIARGLILRADALRHYKKYIESIEDLEEAYDLIISSDVKILLADWHIVAIKLSLDEGNFIKATTYFLEAKKLSLELNDYFIFKEELKKIEPYFDIEVNNE